MSQLHTEVTPSSNRFFGRLLSLDRPRLLWWWALLSSAVGILPHKRPSFRVSSGLGLLLGTRSWGNPEKSRGVAQTDLSVQFPDRFLGQEVVWTSTLRCLPAFVSSGL